MSAVSYAEIKTAVAEALDADPSTEEPILRRCLGDDESALAEARRWVAASREACELFEHPLAGSSGLVPFQSAGPYSVIRRLGSGGMGVVYEVERDGHHYALKSIRPSMVADWSLARFRQEAAILGRLDHPSIARLVDTGLVNDLPFFVMELVEGEPVDAYLEHGSLSLEDRLRLFVQVCRTVGYAHEQGFVHRDLKPSNIWVTRDGVPKLLDFGIAKAVAGNTTLANNDQTLTAHRMITPAYASPEHLRGEATGPGTDVYSLGVMLFEIASGRRFPSAAREQTMPEVGSGERKLDWIVRMALDPDPRKRYGSASLLADDIERLIDGEKIQARGESLGVRMARPMRRHPLAVAALAFAVVAASAWTRFPSHTGAKPRPSVAIAGFLTSGSDAAWVPDALTDALELELSATGKLRVIRGTDVNRIRASFHDELSRGGIPQGLVSQLSADYYVTGQLKPSIDGPVRVLLQFVHRSTNEVAYTETIALSRNQVPMAAYAASRGFQRALGVLTEADVRDSRPIPYLGNPRVAELYGQALEATRVYRYKESRDAIEAAIKIDPDNPVLRLARAKVLDSIGARVEARGESERALKLAGSLPREQQLVIEKLDHQLHGRWDKSEGVLRQLVEIFYDDPRYAADLAHNIGVEGRHKEALELIERFRKTMPAEAVPFWFYAVAIEEATELNDYPRSEQYINLVKQRAAAGSVEFAQVLRLEARVRYRMQKPSEALALYAEAAPFAERGGDWYTLSSCWNEMGIIYYELNQRPQATEYYGRALDLAKKTGTRLLEGNLLNNLGLMAADRGDLAQAERLLQGSLRAYTEVGAHPHPTLSNLGHTQLRLGHLDQAKATLNQALDAARQGGSPGGMGWALYFQTLLAVEIFDDRRAAELAGEGWNAVKDQGPSVAIVAGRLGREMASARKRLGDRQGARAALDETVAFLEKTNASSQLCLALMARISMFVDLGEIASAGQDLARVRKLSRPGLDSNIDRQLELLESVLALQQHYDPKAAAERLSKAAGLSDKEDRCAAGEPLFGLAIRNRDFGSVKRASEMCYGVEIHSTRDREFYAGRVALADWALRGGKGVEPAPVRAALAGMSQHGASGEAAELRSWVAAVAGSRP